MRKAPSSSRAHTSAGPSAGPAAAADALHPSPGRGSPTPRGCGRGRGRGRGMGTRLAHGFAAFFSMCRNIAADVREVARRQRETDDNLRRQASSLGTPCAPRSPDVPLHPPPPEINEWYQQAYGVPFTTADDVGFAAFFSMCQNIAVDVHEVARRQRETDDNLRRQASSLGTPFAPRWPDVPLHPPPPEINKWYQQAYRVPFMTTDDVEEEEAYFDDREQFVPPPYQPPAGLTYLSILLLRRSTSGTSRHTGCLL